MAQKQTTQDAVSAAMSAIEVALNLSAGESHVGGAAPPVSSPSSGSAPVKPSPAAPPALAAAAKTLSAQDPGDPPPLAHRPPPQVGESERALGAGTPPANDDRAAIGPIVQALQSRRPSQAPFVAAAVSGARLAGALRGIRDICASPPTGMDLGGGARLFAPAGDGVARLGGARTDDPSFRLRRFGAPAAGIARLGGLDRSGRVAAGGARNRAGEQLVTLSQAIRREIASMGDGVERALARAAELETLVRSEVSTLERAYSDNERRIRSLIAEMADQREAIIANGGRVRVAVDQRITGSPTDLEAIAERLGESISNVGERIATSLGASSEEIAAAMEYAGAETVDRIAAQGAQMQESLSAVGADVATRLAEASSRSADEIVARVADIDQRIKDNAAQTVEAIQAQGEAVATRSGRRPAKQPVTRQRTFAVERNATASSRGSTTLPNDCTKRSWCAGKRSRTRSPRPTSGWLPF